MSPAQTEIFDSFCLTAKYDCQQSNNQKRGEVDFRWSSDVILKPKKIDFDSSVSGICPACNISDD